jgi:hypothetical protein
MVQLKELQGSWYRSLIVWPGGKRDATTSVMWLQGPTFYADLRQPMPAADYAAVRGLRDLTAIQVANLARQEGFAGVLVEHPDHFEWMRYIDYQPKPVYSDRGMLEDRGYVMIEQGLDIQYIEHWHREGGESAPAAAWFLRDAINGTRGILVCAGRRFMFARERAVSLNESRPLSEYLRGASSLSDAQDLIDCELSAGFTGEGWRIESSSLPYRVGASLSPTRSRDGLQTGDVTQDGEPIERAWSIVEYEGCVNHFLKEKANGHAVEL